MGSDAGAGRNDKGDRPDYRADPRNDRCFRGTAERSHERNRTQRAECDAGIQDVAGSSIEVNRGASKTGAASGEVLKTAQTLSVESRRLRQELDGFMVTIRAA
jgi:hypothetical protein